MGLTIHYTIRPKRGWSLEKIRAKLEEVRQKAMDLPVVDVSESINEFEGDNANFNRVDREDENRWFLVQACRSVKNKWQPGRSRTQSPSRVIGFSVDPGDGSEECNFGLCEWERCQWDRQALKINEEARYVWDRYPYLPKWDNVANGNPFFAPAESVEIIKSFLEKYNLEFTPEWAERRRQTAPRQLFGINLTSSRGWLSKEAAYAGLCQVETGGDVRGIVAFCDNSNYSEFGFSHKGTPKEFQAITESREFRRDLKDLLTGRKHSVKADKYWNSFCKTQYAADPECGGVENFLKSHLNVIALLDHLQEVGFHVDVRDEGEYWESRNIDRLIKNLGEYDSLVAGIAGALKDAMGGTVVAPILERNDFERLEAEGQCTLPPELIRLLKETQKKEGLPSF